MLVKIDVFWVNKNIQKGTKRSSGPKTDFLCHSDIFLEARDGGTRWPAVGSAGQIVKISGTLKYQNRQNPYSWKLFGEVLL